MKANSRLSAFLSGIQTREKSPFRSIDLARSRIFYQANLETIRRSAADETRGSEQTSLVNYRGEGGGEGGGGGEELSGVGEKPRRKLAGNLSAQTEGKYDGKVSRTK